MKNLVLTVLILGQTCAFAQDIKYGPKDINGQFDGGASHFGNPSSPKPVQRRLPAPTQNVQVPVTKVNPSTDGIFDGAVSTDAETKTQKNEPQKPAKFDSTYTIHPSSEVTAQSNGADQAMIEGEPTDFDIQAPPVAGNGSQNQSGADLFPKVFVQVDKTNQELQIQIVNQDGSQIPLPDPNFNANVSTGGGLKIPNGVEVAGKLPYCASTPKIAPYKYIPAITSGKNTTMERVHYSKTFEDEEGNQIAMPYAIRVVGGIFFHEVPPSYKKKLGYAVSGECIRLAPGTAKMLWNLALKYKGIHVSIVGEDPEPVVIKKLGIDNRCNQDSVIAAAKGRENAIRSGKQFSGKGFLSDFFGLFSGPANPSKKKKSRPGNSFGTSNKGGSTIFTNPLGWN